MGHQGKIRDARRQFIDALSLDILTSLEDEGFLRPELFPDDDEELSKRKTLRAMNIIGGTISRVLKVVDADIGTV